MLAKFSGKLRHLWSYWQRPNSLPITYKPVILLSIGVTALILGLRQGVTFSIPGLRLGLKMEALELGTYDQFVRFATRDPNGKSLSPKNADPRLLVVAITEEDIQKLGQWPIPDGKMAELLTKLEKHQPRVIGLDIYRDLPVPPGHEKLVKYLEKSDRLIAICKLSEADSPGVAPPKALSPKQVGFSDLIIDPDGVIRRALLFARKEQGKCPTFSAFSYQLASRYLAFEGIESFKATPEGALGFRSSKKTADGKKIKPVVFPRLDSNAGGYQGADVAGYQILLKYHSAENVARQVTLTQVLHDRVPGEWIRDRIVLIGAVAASIDDAFYTPYSAAQNQQHKMPGVVVHAQIVSQIIRAVLDNRTLPWYWPNWAEALWIWSWAIIGGVGAWKLRHPLILGISGVGAFGVLSSISYGFWLSSGWIPLVPAALSMVTTGGSVVVIAAYRMQQEREKMLNWVKEQEETIALLSTMYKGNLATTVQNSHNTSETTVATAPLCSPKSLSAISPKFSERYQIIKVLGQGGFGRTYLAKDSENPAGEICVVKHLMPARRDPKFLEVARRLFQTEARILEVLGQHEQIPTLIDYIEKEGEFYLVEEYVEGNPLSEELYVDRRWQEIQVIDLLKDVLPILNFIHQHHVIHRDIKPGNIIRRASDGKLVLIDFGAVKQMLPTEGGKTESQTVAIGTRGYAPPEQLVGHPRPASDLYALGMICIQALTGIQPHDLLLLQDIETGNLNWQHLAKTSGELAVILDRMVQYHFSDRYQSALAILSDIQKLDRTNLDQIVREPDFEEKTAVLPTTESDNTSVMPSWNHLPVNDQSTNVEEQLDRHPTKFDPETHKS
ncbi:CHASE2 domain-containing protein [Aerosakkonemataceae cyanobacterium BLCC-F154]|uniref:non-specific serine/threonine protein kinase n=1 Tax=Floridaenema fluviatile BLCC-F154 TaxID=3153640 RepID=A0ABV4YKM5_9CYAN